jgi:hypothetical protein
MMGRRLSAAIAAAALLAPVALRAQAAADNATLLRVFLSDGTSLVSYGEPARAGDRVVFSMPTAATPNPPLTLVNLPIARVDWDRTSRYAANARATRYVQTQAEADYAQLSNDVAATLNDVAHAATPTERLLIVERARKTLAEWPENHFNFRRTEVQQMLAMLDEAIVDLQAATGRGRYTLSLSAFAEPPGPVEPLQPPPTPKEAIEQVLAAARVTDSAADRTSLLSSAIASIDRDKASLPDEWVSATRAATEAAVAIELRDDRNYRLLTTQTMAQASRQARAADVRGLERLLLALPQRDSALGYRRPDAVNALVAAVQEKLDAARRLRLARDRFELRQPVLAEYGLAIGTPMALLTQLGPSLEAVKSLSGSSPVALATIQQKVARILALAAAIVPPQEVAAAHALLISAAQLAGNAAQIRREATLAGDMARAWDASSAAAGALMLGARARADIQNALRPPQLR